MKPRLAVIGTLLLITLSGIFDHDLWTPDEPRAAELGREFLDSQSWAVPTLNGRYFMEKPPLVYWTVAGSLEIFGIHDWAARLPCVFFGWGTLLFIWLLARRFYGERAAVAALLVAATTYCLARVGHHLEADAGLLFFVTGAAYFFHRGTAGSSWNYGLFSLFALGAFFCKGFIGFVFLGFFVLAWVIWTRTPRELWRARIWLWAPLVAVPIALWFWALKHDARGDLLQVFLVDNHLKRFFSGAADYEGGHKENFFYYFYMLPSEFLPWTIAILFAIPWIWSRRRESPERFLLSWFLPGFAFLCAAGTKRGIYLAPILPPLAILTGAWIDSKGKTRALSIAVGATAAVLSIASPFVMARVDKSKSMKPFCVKTGDIVRDSTLYAFEPDETTRAVVPFYTGMYFEELNDEKSLEAMYERISPFFTGSHQQESAPWIFVLTVDKRKESKRSAAVAKFFPHLWLGSDASEGRRMYLYSKLPKP